MFARFDENPAMTLRVIKETKRYGRTDGQRENSIPPTNKVCGGYKKYNFQTHAQTIFEGLLKLPKCYAQIFGGLLFCQNGIHETTGKF